MRKTTRKRWRRILWSALHACLLLFLTYLAWNIPIDRDSGDFLLKLFSTSKATAAQPDTIPDDLLLVNTCYDHTLVPVYNEMDEEIGQQNITDRRKLLELGKFLYRTDSYRYVVCDIRFDGSLKTDADSALFSLLNRMPRCCVPWSSAMESFPRKLIPVAATSEYITSFLSNDFLKYQYLTADGESIALRMAGVTDSIHITRWGPLYFMDGALCINSHIVDIETNVSIDNNANKNYILHLGYDAMPIVEIGAEKVFRDRIVIIGDCFLNDMHNTVAGSVSGPMIIYNAYKALVAKRNVPSWWVWLLVLLVYYLLTLATLCHFEPHDLLRMLRLRDKPLLNLLFDWVGFQILFTLLALLVYTTAGLYIDAWICAFYFTVFGKLYLYKTQKR